jgi:hypothetical protein
MATYPMGFRGHLLGGLFHCVSRSFLLEGNVKNQVKDNADKVLAELVGLGRRHMSCLEKSSNDTVVALDSYVLTGGRQIHLVRRWVKRELDWFDVLVPLDNTNKMDSLLSAMRNYAKEES